MDETDFLKGLQIAFLDFVFGDIDYTKLRNSPSGTKVMLLNQAFKNRPDIQEKIKEEVLNIPIENLYDLDEMRQLTRDALTILRRLFQNDGIFCTSVDWNNLLMWAHYADQHRGAAIELTPSVEKDSVLLVSKEVRYTNVRPLLYRESIDMVMHGLAMSPGESAEKLYDSLIYTKSSE